jgi:hypothetical protein
MRNLFVTYVNRLIAGLICAFLLTAPASSEDVPDSPWPREIQATQGTVLMYQPQPQQLDGIQLEPSAAVSATLVGTDEPDTTRQSQGDRTANADQARNQSSQRTDRQSSGS